MSPTLLSGIDLPTDFICGSLDIAYDIYAKLDDQADITFLGLPPMGQRAVRYPVRTIDLDRNNMLVRDYRKRLRKEVQSIIDDLQPDLIHAHHLIYGMTDAFVASDYAGPMIALAHGTDVYDVMHDSSLLSEADRNVERADMIVVPTRELAVQARAAGLRLPPEKTRVLTWALPDAAQQYRSTGQLSSGRPSVIVASRLTANKNVAVVIEALTHTASPLRLVVRGVGPELPRLRRLAADAPARHRIEFVPSVVREQHWQDLARHDLAVFPTLEVEAFGLFGLECLTLGVPLLVAENAVLREVFPHAPTFPPDSPRQLGACLDRLVASRSERRRLVAGGDRILARYLMEDLAAGLVSLKALTETGVPL